MDRLNVILVIEFIQVLKHLQTHFKVQCRDDMNAQISIVIMMDH